MSDVNEAKTARKIQSADQNGCQVHGCMKAKAGNGEGNLSQATTTLKYSNFNHFYMTCS